MTEPTTQPVRIGGEPMFRDPVRVLDAVPGDPVFAPPTADEVGPAPSITSQLQQALAAPTRRPDVVLEVKERPGVGIRFDCNISDEQRKAWQRRATSKKGGRGGNEGTLDEMLFSAIVVANQARAILFGGEEAPAVDGHPLTFTLRELWDMVGAADAVTAVRALYGNDAHVMGTAGEIALRAGFDDTIEEAEDPTTASSRG